MYSVTFEVLPTYILLPVKMAGVVITGCYSPLPVVASGFHCGQLCHLHVRKSCQALTTYVYFICTCITIFSFVHYTYTVLLLDFNVHYHGDPFFPHL